LTQKKIHHPELADDVQNEEKFGQQVHAGKEEGNKFERRPMEEDVS
jgi:hypothetical protein